METKKLGNITIASMQQIDPSKYDEVWAIVRSPKYAPQGFIHVPELSPSWELFNKYLELKDKNNWNSDTFRVIYRPQFIAEIEKSKAARDKLNELVVKYRAGKSIALTCFCKNASLCHRSIISEMLKSKGIPNTLMTLTIKEANAMKKPIFKKENKTMSNVPAKKPLIIAATNSAFRQDFGKNEMMKIAKACCPEDHMLYTFTGARENNKVVALSLINIFNNKIVPAHKDTWDPALYSEFVGSDGVKYEYGTMDAQTKMEYVYAYIKRTFGSLDALVFTTPYDDDRSLVNTFDKVSVFVRADGFTYKPAVYQATGDPIIENGKQAVWYSYTEDIEERYVKVSAKRYMQFNFEDLPLHFPARSLKPDYNASYINDSNNYWSDEYDCMIEKGNKYSDAYALQHAFRFKADADMTKDLENYDLFRQVFDCHDYKVRRSRYDTYTMDPRVSKEDMAQEIEYMKAVQKFIAETGHVNVFLKDRNCPVCNKHFVGDVCPRCKHKYDESAPERELAIGSIKIMDMIGRNEDGDIVVGTEAADEYDWLEDNLNIDIADVTALAEYEDC